MPKSHFKTKTIRLRRPGLAQRAGLRHYNPAEVIDGRTLAAHLRFSIAYWHSFRGVGADPFGPGTIQRPWRRARTRSHRQGAHGRRLLSFPENPRTLAMETGSLPSPRPLDRCPGRMDRPRRRGTSCQYAIEKRSAPPASGRRSPPPGCSGERPARCARRAFVANGLGLECDLAWIGERK